MLIDGGRLLHAGPTAALLAAHRARSGSRSTTGPSELVAALAARRRIAATAVDDATVDVATDDDASLDAVRDAVDDLGLALHALTSRRHSLDELFVRLCCGSAPDPIAVGLAGARAAGRSPAEPMTAVTGAVYDRGYRPYDGTRRRPQARLALLRLSVRRALGLRRSWRQKVFPWTLLGDRRHPGRSCNVGVSYLTRDSPAEDFEFFTYREYVGVSTTLLLFVALTAPDVVCPDRRNRVLPLIFARPLTGGRLRAWPRSAPSPRILFGFGFLPQVRALHRPAARRPTTAPSTTSRDNAEVLWQVPIAVAVLAIHYAVIGVALAATTSRRVVGGVAMLAVLLVTSTIAGIVTEVQAGEDGASAWALVNVLALPLHLRDLVFLGHIDPEGDLAGVARRRASPWSSSRS